MEKQIVLFVHGLTGKVRSTGKHGTWGKFPDLIQSDPELSPMYESAQFGFPSPKFRLRFVSSAPRAQTIAKALKTEIDVRYENRPIVLVGHSLGGLIVRQYIVDQIKGDQPKRVSRIALFGTPNTGASLAKVGKLVSPFQPQIKQLCQNSEFVSSLNDDWKDLRLLERLDTLCVVGGADELVSEESAKSYWPSSSVQTVINAGHSDLVKPRDGDDLRYLILKKFLLFPSAIGVPSEMRRQAIYLGLYGSQLALSPELDERERGRLLSEIAKLSDLHPNWIARDRWSATSGIDGIERTFTEFKNTSKVLANYFSLGFTCLTFFNSINKFSSEGDEFSRTLLYQQKGQVLDALLSCLAPDSIVTFLREHPIEHMTSDVLMRRIIEWK